MKANVYLEFLRYCLNPIITLPVSAKSIDWMDMMAWAESQAIVGVIFQGVERGHKQLQIPFDDLMEWVGYAHDIEEQNKLLNKRCVEVVAAFQKDGFETCILKGQGNAMMYPNPLLRTPGDIDLWAMPQLTIDNGKLRIKEVIKYVRCKNPEGKVQYHHVDYGEFKGVEVEVHYRPSFANNLVVNRKLQRWFNSHTESTESTDLPNNVGKITVPTWEFNVLFQLSHIYNHLIHEGIGLKQMIDYFYLLQMRNEKGEMRNGNEKLEMTLRQLGLMKIAGAVMYVLKEALGMEDKYLIVPVDERRGRFLLSEIMEGGNFGRELKTDAGWLSSDSAIGRNILRLKRDARLVCYFPSECLWEPIFRLWHFGWRMTHEW